jgi:hypothetical protein
MHTESVNTKGNKLKNFRFQTTEVFDKTLVGRIYSEQNCDEWYDMLYRLSDEEMKAQCRFFHLEIILNCAAMTERYETLLAEKFSQLN